MTDSAHLAQELSDALGDGYVVERALGEGGFAIVFLVRDAVLKRNLAVKVLSPDVITSRSMLERFRREAETVAQLSHPNIVPVHFIGERDGLLWLAMQCVEGGSIADRLEREGRLPVEDVARIGGEVAAALAHAHKRSVIHRDIKPANVLVDPETGRCLVTDFGIARTVDAAALTATGMMLGTPAYLSPEQITGDTIDHRVDIYALGVMMYEMLAGQLPFQGANATAGMMKRLAGPPAPVASIRPEVPRELSAIVAKCLAPEPADRFQSASDLADALRGVNVATRGTTRSGGRTARMLAAGAALAAVVGAGWWFGRGRATPSTMPDLVTIPAGSYVIGSDAGAPENRPRHVERLAAFRIERTEVTTGAYERFVIGTRAAAPWPGARPDSTLPVTGVPWGDAANYCAWKYPRGGRLPVEAEWEAAARGSSGRAYPYGDTLATAAANTASAARGRPVPVASFPRGATPEGVQDMSGNVWEWTSSPMRAYPGERAMPDSMSRYRVIRGGAFDTDDSNATAWTRGYLRVTSAPAELPRTGFRCVVSGER